MKTGFLGAGNMAGAIIRGMLGSGFPKEEILYSRRTDSDKPELAGVTRCTDNRSLVAQSDCVVLAVKPQVAAGVLAEVRDLLADKFVISIMAGWTYEKLSDALPESTRFVRVMPNTPLAVGAGMTLVSEKRRCTDEEFAYARSLFDAAGATVVVEERIFTPANGISGCGPAYVFAFIEALADGGVRCGVPRKMAYELAAQTLIGAAKTVLETGKHPGELKDAVCSPGGATIEGMFALEKGGMRASVIDAVSACVEKTYRMEK